MRQILALSICLLALGGTPADAQAPPPPADDHEALRALLVTATEAVNRGDAEALAPLLAPDFVATFSDQSRVTSPSELSDYLDRLLHAENAPLSSIHLQPVADAATGFIGADVGVAYGSSKDTFRLRDGTGTTLDSRWTATLVKVDGRWRIRAFHAGVDMLDNPILDAAHGLTWAWAAGGLLLGLVLGWTAARRKIRVPSPPGPSG